MLEVQSLWHEGPGRSVLRRETIARAPGLASVRMLWSGISRGTERLIAEGRVPESEYDRMRGPNMGGAFPFPVKYGYQAVGRVEDGPEALVGRAVFALHPHQTAFALPPEALVPLPDALPPRRAVLAANMETALNAVWDSGVSPGDRVAVIGAGALGLLTASILARMPGVEATVVDLEPQRGEIAAELGARFALPDTAPHECDIAFEASACADGLTTAMGVLGDEGTLVEMSWLGAGATPVPLGGAFHSRRLRLISSQVGRIPSLRAPRWTHRRRIEKALELLCDPRLDALITDEVAFADLPARLPDLLRGPGIATAVRYD